MKWALILLIVLVPSKAQAVPIEIGNITLPVRLDYKDHRVIKATSARFIKKYFRSFIREDREKAFQASMNPGLVVVNQARFRFDPWISDKKPFLSYKGIEVLEDLRVRLNIRDTFLADIYHQAPPDLYPKKFKKFSSSLISFDTRFRLNISLDVKDFFRSLGLILSKTYQIYSYKIRVQSKYKYRFKKRESTLTFGIKIM